MKKSISIGNIFGTIRKGLEYLQKINKLLQSIMIVQEHSTNLINDLEKIWDTEPKKATEL